MFPIVRVCFAIGLGFLSSVPALAQSNLPYQAGGAGMSLGYRQAILNDHLLGSRPSALVRGPGGELLDVERRGRQAFLRSPDSGAFLTGARPRNKWPTGLGTGLGWSGAFRAGSSGSYSSRTWHASDSLTHWIAMIPSNAGQSYNNGQSSVGGSSPINIWIQML